MSYMGLVPMMVDFCDQIKENRRQSRQGNVGRIQILEIGVANGHSIARWLYYFPNSIIHAVDIKKSHKFKGILPGIKPQSKIDIYLKNRFGWFLIVNFSK